MATKISSSQFRNSSAIEQWNLTSKTMTDFYIDWTSKEETDSLNQADDLETNDFDPETKSGGEQNVLKLTSELNRNLKGISTYFKRGRRKTGFIMSPNNTNPYIKMIAFVKSYTEVDFQNQTKNKDEVFGLQILTLLADAQSKVAKLSAPEKDQKFRDSVDSVIKRYETIGEDDFDDLINFVGIKEDKKVFNNYLKGLQNAEKDILDGNEKFVFFELKTKKGNYTMGDPTNSSIYLYIYNMLPSKVKNPANVVPAYYNNNHTYYFEDGTHNIQAIDVKTAQQASLFLNKLNVDLKELNTIFAEFSIRSGRMADSELKEINKEVEGVVESFKTLINEEYYIEIGGKQYPNIISSANSPSADDVAINNSSENMFKMYNTSYLEFSEKYVKLFDTLRQSRNI